MNPYSVGDRVILLKPHAGISKGSRGTVKAVAPASVRVRYDVDPSRFVQTPISILAPAGATVAGGAPLTFSTAAESAHAELFPTEKELLWFPPSNLPIAMATDETAVAVTETVGTLTLLLQNAGVVLRGRTRSGAFAGAAEFPIEGAPRKVAGQMRAFVEQADDGCTAIVLTIAGSVLAKTYRGKGPGDVVMDVFAEIPADTSSVVLALFVTAERQSTLTDTVVQIDSLDLVAT